MRFALVQKILKTRFIYLKELQKGGEKDNLPPPDLFPRWLPQSVLGQAKMGSQEFLPGFSHENRAKALGRSVAAFRHFRWKQNGNQSIRTQGIGG